MIAELKHLRNYLGLFLDTYNQRVSTFTLKKLKSLLDTANVLKGDNLGEFFECDEESFYKFYNANLRYDRAVRHWLSHFKVLPDIGKLAGKVEEELENWGENYRSSKLLLSVIRKINKCGITPLKEKDEIEWIKRACEIEDAKKGILTNTDLSDVRFTGEWAEALNEKRETSF